MLTWRSFKLYNMFDPAYWADGAPVMVTFLVHAHICHATDVDFPWTHAWCFGCYGSEGSGRCCRSLESVMLWNWLRLEDVMMLLPDCWCWAIVIELAHIFHALELVVLGGCLRDVPWSCTHVWSGLPSGWCSGDGDFPCVCSTHVSCYRTCGAREMLIFFGYIFGSLTAMDLILPGDAEVPWTGTHVWCYGPVGASEMSLFLEIALVSEAVQWGGWRGLDD